MRLSVPSALTRFSLTGCAALLPLVLILSATAFGQATSSSSVAGLVTDQQKAAVPGADVTLTDPSSNNTMVAKTNNDGRYIFIDVGSGTYSITVAKPGFS